MVPSPFQRQPFFLIGPKSLPASAFPSNWSQVPSSISPSFSLVPSHLQRQPFLQIGPKFLPASAHPSNWSQVPASATKTCRLGSQGLHYMPYNGKMPGQVFAHCKTDFVGARVWLECVQGRSPWQSCRGVTQEDVWVSVDLTHLPKSHVQADTPCYSAPCRTCQPCQSKRRSKGSGLLILET